MEDDQQKVLWAEGPSSNGNGSRKGGIIDRVGGESGVV